VSAIQTTGASDARKGNRLLPVLIKGGIEAATRSLAIEYAPQGIRVNTVAAGIIDMPMHPEQTHEALRGLSPANRIGSVQEVVEAVLYLDSAAFVSGEILHVDGGAHAGKWCPPRRDRRGHRWPEPRRVGSSGRATMTPVWAGTRARYAVSSSSSVTSRAVVDACSNLTLPCSSR